MLSRQHDRRRKLQFSVTTRPTDSISGPFNILFDMSSHRLLESNDRPRWLIMTVNVRKTEPLAQSPAIARIEKT
jgi:hypothetical protein